MSASKTGHGYQLSWIIFGVRGGMVGDKVRLGDLKGEADGDTVIGVVHGKNLSERAENGV